jgi:hypothetical protein
MLAFKGSVVETLEISGLDPQDYPDFCDAYFSYAEYENGTPLTDDELDELTDLYPDVVNEMCLDC